MKTKINFKKLVAIMFVFTLLFGVSCSCSGGPSPQNKAEAVAVKFLEKKYEGNAQKCVDLLFDELVDEAISAYGYETEDVLVYALDKELNAAIEEYIEEYGKKCTDLILLLP